MANFIKTSYIIFGCRKYLLNSWLLPLCVNALALKEFDYLSEFGNLDIVETSEDVVGIEINRLHESPQTDIIRILKNIKKQSAELEKKIVSYLEQNTLDTELKNMYFRGY
jgi:hypothetical protein